MPARIQLDGGLVQENPEAGTVVGSLRVLEGTDGEQFTFSLPEEERFQLVAGYDPGTYNIVVRNSTFNGASLFDFENDALNSFAISVTAVGDNGTSLAAS